MTLEAQEAITRAQGDTSEGAVECIKGQLSILTTGSSGKRKQKLVLLCHLLEYRIKAFNF